MGIVNPGGVRLDVDHPGNPVATDHWQNKSGDVLVGLGFARRGAIRFLSQVDSAGTVDGVFEGLLNQRNGRACIFASGGKGRQFPGFGMPVEYGGTLDPRQQPVK